MCLCVCALVRVPVRATNSQTENTMYMQIIIYVGGKKHLRSGGGSHERYKEYVMCGGSHERYKDVYIRNIDMYVCLYIYINIHT